MCRRSMPPAHRGTRLCSRPGCAEPAAATLTYRYDVSAVWIDDLTPERAQPRFDGAGHPDWLARHLSGVFGLIRAGEFERVAEEP